MHTSKQFPETGTSDFPDVGLTLVWQETYQALRLKAQVDSPVLPEVIPDAP